MNKHVIPSSPVTDRLSLLTLLRILSTTKLSTPPSPKTRQLIPTLPAPALSTLYRSASTNKNDAQYNNTYSNNQVQITATSINIPNKNYASITSNHHSPKRDQALVFIFINGRPQKEYIVAIGQIVSSIYSPNSMQNLQQPFLHIFIKQKYSRRID